MTSFFEALATKLHLHFLKSHPLSGGDINKVFLLQFEEGEFVIKLNSLKRFPGIFQAEAKGLKLLEASRSFLIPEVFDGGELNSHAYLLIKYLEPSDFEEDFSSLFAEKLVKLHKTTQTKFGLDHDNHIGSLPQQNDFCETPYEFYISQRLLPQFKMAHDKGFKFSTIESLFKNLYDEIPDEAPSLIHGDLWNGNYLNTKNGPALIDPAVSFGPREMDLAMMKLFGGFDSSIFDKYNELFPLRANWKNRIEVWQLYYLLVHLNLFGPGYLQGVENIVRKYS